MDETGHTQDISLTVIIPVLNGGVAFGAQLDALLWQETPHRFEILVVDGGSTDGTIELVRQRFAGHDDHRLVTAPSAGVAVQRNYGVPLARSASCALCDADDLVGPHWVTGMVAALGRAELAGGPTYIANASRLAEVIAEMHVVDWARSAVRPDTLHFGYLPSPLGCNLGFRSELWADLGGFQPELEGIEDLDFVWRGLERGALLEFDERAVVAKGNRPDARSRFKQHFRNSLVAPRAFRAHSAHGMPRVAPGRTAQYLRVILATPRMLLRPRYRYGWAGPAGDCLGRLIGSVRARTFFP